MSVVTGWVREVFASIQGEGLYCGQRQTFVRFAGCNLRCAYCDTPAALDSAPPNCSIEQTAAGGDFKPMSNPVTARQVASACSDLGSRVVALTGGEPLVQPAFAQDLLRELKSLGLRTYLETNGTLPEALEQVVDWCDVIAMDVKLPSASGGAHWDEHSRFLRLARRTGVFLKLVVSRDTAAEEVCRAAKMNAEDGAVPMVIQPVFGELAPSGPDLARMQDIAGEFVEDVRVIPQCHLVIGVL